jgi:microcystin-dependent protein
MSSPFVGQLMLVPYNFAPVGWFLCNGQLLEIEQYTALFSLIGTTYGGDGRTTFALPDLRGRVPVSSGQGAGLSNYDLGETYGVESVTLAATQIPAHNHAVHCNGDAATEPGPKDHYPGGKPEGGVDDYSATRNTQMNTEMIGNTGGGEAHENRQPSLVLNWIIAYQGIFPNRG